MAKSFDQGSQRHIFLAKRFAELLEECAKESVIIDRKPSTSASPAADKTVDLGCKSNRAELVRLENAARTSSLLSLNLDAKELRLNAELQYLQNAIESKCVDSLPTKSLDVIEAKIKVLHSQCSHLLTNLACNKSLELSLLRTKHRRQIQETYLEQLKKKESAASRQHAKLLIIYRYLKMEKKRFEAISSLSLGIASNFDSFLEVVDKFRARLGMRKQLTSLPVEEAYKENIMPVAVPSCHLSAARQVDEQFRLLLRHLLKDDLLGLRTEMNTDPASLEGLDSQLLTTLDEKVAFVKSRTAESRTHIKEFLRIATKIMQMHEKSVQSLGLCEISAVAAVQAKWFDSSSLYWTSLSSLAGLCPLKLLSKLASTRSELDCLESELKKLQFSVDNGDAF
ncbi:unnamed protein product [Schistocephalus solidus]|uniref:HAUS augmin-like complex subunit 4 n=1 Tax=Schistocephalus solidus TaxID=70667 RepID=A0A183T5V8_SCHSO|nr:unnamed protein product [Schistocephalus solidus]